MADNPGFTFERWGDGTPGPNVGPAPGAAPQSASGLIGPAPVGALVPDWLKGQTEGANSDSNDALAMASGAIEARPALQRLRAQVAAAPPHAFGNFRGSDLNSSMNQGLDALTGGMLPGSNLASTHEMLNSAYDNAALPLIKQYFGAVPRSPDLQNKALGVLGGTRVSDQATALQMIDAAIANGNDKINRGISLGRVSPGNLPQQISPAPGGGITQWGRGPNGTPQPVGQ